MKRSLSTVIAFSLFSFLVMTVVIFAQDLVNLRCGQGVVTGTTTCRISITDRSGGDLFFASIMCEECHKVPLKSGQDLRKSYDNQSQSKHFSQYIYSLLPKDVSNESRYLLAEGSRYEWAKGVYIVNDKGRLKVINYTEKYQFLLDADAVIVKDRYNRPFLIITEHPVKKAALSTKSPRP